MFEPVSPSVSFPELDQRWLTYWETNRIFEKSVEASRDKPAFVFYEGPPTANGMPHPGHVLTRVMKDVFLRYRSMAGYHVPRWAGWDTHGLPVEVEVEKELGIHGRADIEKYGVEAFTKRCIDSVFRYIEEWRRMTRRIAFWVDLDAAYVTFHTSYVESVWWALKTMFEQGLLYQDYKIVWWWPQGGTALSSGEVGQGYKEVDDPSITVRFPVVGKDKTAFLAWTTTPWTLPSNVALAVHPETTYVTALVDGEQLIMAKAVMAKMLGDKEHRVVAEQKGRELVGLKYTPPFQYAEAEGGRAWEVVAAEFVTTETGSGMVHIAPAFGEDDFRVCREQGLGMLQLVAPDGTFVPAVTDFAGRFCKEADRDIIRNLRQRGLLFHEELYRHDYPFCWRAMEDPLIQYARRSWFIRTTQEIHRTIENNGYVHWEPEHIKDGRFGAFLRTNVDWAISRERYWGTPLPVWINDHSGKKRAIASCAELEALNPHAFDAFAAAKQKDPSLSDHLKVHKPWVDEITFTVPGEEGTYRRVSEVIDCWFDSGCMPFAQHGYPRTNVAQFESTFPADFITEAVDQTRGWFYSLMMISTLLFPEQPYPHPFRNCVVLGLISDEKGRKLSKSLKNYTDPLEMIAKEGGDAVRWSLYTGTVPGQGTRFTKTAASDALRDFLLKLWNVYSFFVSYANIDGWAPGATNLPVSERSDLDRWILAELDQTVRDVRGALDDYKSHLAARKLEDFNESLSNWYVRRSRARFWATGDSVDKASAFATLYEVLVDYAKLIAPFAPFIAEEMFRNLVKGAEESVHLSAFPVARDDRKNDMLRRDVELARTVVNLGARVRSEKKLKVRQPLAEAIVVVASDEERAAIERNSAEIKDELNVHTLSFTREPAKYVQFALVPNFRALGPKLGKNMPACKKALESADGSVLHAELEAKGAIELTLPDGTKVSLGPEEIEVRLTAKESYAAAASKGHVVVIDTRVDDALKREGLAREAVNRIQRARKTLDLAYDARIHVGYEAKGELARALEEHRDYVAGETLATAFAPGSGKGERNETDVDGEPFVFFVAKVP